MGLLDAAQAASNAAASTVSGPVDMLAWLLRKAGVNVGEPVGGSDWMKRKGLTKDVAPGASQVVGETLGLLAPTVAAAKAPQIAKGLLAAADNLAAPRTLNPQQGAIVWHGSPHKFDRFDSSKIGTGEGAQAYGHGLYLAESPKVAGEYANMFAKSPTTPTQLLRLRDGAPKGSSEWAHYDDLLKNGQGALYKVDLPDNAIARMLDWDKPLSQQPINDLLAKIDWKARSSSTRGTDLYDRMTDVLGSQSAAANELRRAGIPGIRYLDGGSRGAGSGTSNFVVFPGEEGLLTILERNGVPLR